MRAEVRGLAGNEIMDMGDPVVRVSVTVKIFALRGFSYPRKHQPVSVKAALAIGGELTSVEATSRHC